MDAAAAVGGGGGLLDDHALTHLPPLQVDVQVRLRCMGEKVDWKEGGGRRGRRKTHKNRIEQGVMGSMVTRRTDLENEIEAIWHGCQVKVPCNQP